MTAELRERAATAKDGSVAFDLMRSGVLDELAAWIESLFRAETDRLLAAVLLAKGPAFTNHADPFTSLEYGLTPLSTLRLGAGDCTSRATVLAGILSRLRDPQRRRYTPFGRRIAQRAPRRDHEAEHSRPRRDPWARARAYCSPTATSGPSGQRSIGTSGAGRLYERLKTAVDGGREPFHLGSRRFTLQYPASRYRELPGCGPAARDGAPPSVPHDGARPGGAHWRRSPLCRACSSAPHRDGRSDHSGGTT